MLTKLNEKKIILLAQQSQLWYDFSELNESPAAKRLRSRLCNFARLLLDAKVEELVLPVSKDKQ